jgi:hypothetical protein
MCCALNDAIILQKIAPAARVVGKVLLRWHSLFVIVQISGAGSGATLIPQHFFRLSWNLIVVPTIFPQTPETRAAKPCWH